MLRPAFYHFALITSLSVLLALSTARAEPTTGQRVGEAIDSAIDRSSEAVERAARWLSASAGEAKQHASQRWDALLSRVPDPIRGVRILNAVPVEAPEQTTSPKSQAASGLIPATGGPADLGPLVWMPMENPGAPKPTDRLVIFIAGLHDVGGLWDQVWPELHRRGIAVARFDYVSEQAISQSADDLLLALRDLRARGYTKVDIVAHSLAGLITRDALTRLPEAMPMVSAGSLERLTRSSLPRADRVILVTVPNHGSSLTSMRWVLEARAHAQRWIESGSSDPAPLLGFLKQPERQVGRDLQVDSAFLTELNGRPNHGVPPDSRVTLITARLLVEPSAQLGKILGSPALRKVFSPQDQDRLHNHLHSLTEAVGDGVVSARSQQLEGVSDVVEVAAHHRSVVRHYDILRKVRDKLGGESQTPPGAQAILDRLLAP